MRLTPILISWFGQWFSAIPEEKKLSRDAKVSLIIHSFFQFGASMSGVFLNLYLWRLTHSLSVNGIYNILTWLIAPLGFALGGWLAKKKDRMYTYRIGLLLFVLFYLAVIFAQEKIVDYYVLFALFGGLAGSFYWTGYLTLMYDVSTSLNRIRFLAINMIMFTGAGLIGPALAGFIISQSVGLQGYIIIFTISFFMFFAAGLISLKIKALPSQRKAYYLKYTWLLMRKNPGWLRSLFSFLGFGMLQGSMLFLPNIMLYQVLAKEEWVGYLGVLFSGVMMASGYYISRYAQESQRVRYFLYSAIGFTFGAILLLWSINIWTVIGFMVVYSLFSPLQGNSLTSTYFGIIGNLQPKGQFRVESVVVREIFVNIGRVTSVSILLLFASNLQGSALPWMLVIFSLAQFSLPLLIRKIE
jgi:MFS transporter, YQGE family, putative transporter